jgi:phage-related baseplate assembly protein
MDALDLSLLPPPDIIETLDYETLLAERKKRFLSLYPEEEREEMARRLEIESEPILIVLQEQAYESLILRARINDAARSNMLAFAAGGDLDHLGAFYGVVRIEGETDTRFRKRITLQVSAIAGNGSQERYASVALTADSNVIDAVVLSRVSGSVDVAVWISDLPRDATLPPGVEYAGANAAHHAAVLAAVETAFATDGARPLGVSLTVYEAVPRPVDVTATVMREDSAPLTLVGDLATRLPKLITQHAQLGRNVSRSLLLAWLHVTGISRVELTTPEGDLSIAHDAYATPGVITLTDGGIDW